MNETTDELYLLRREIQELRKEISLMRTDILQIKNIQRQLNRVDSRTHMFTKIGEKNLSKQKMIFR